MTITKKLLLLALLILGLVLSGCKSTNMVIEKSPSEQREQELAKFEKYLLNNGFINDNINNSYMPDTIGIYKKVTKDSEISATYTQSINLIYLDYYKESTISQKDLFHNVITNYYYNGNDATVEIQYGNSNKINKIRGVYDFTQNRIDTSASSEDAIFLKDKAIEGKNEFFEIVRDAGVNLKIISNW